MEVTLDQAECLIFTAAGKKEDREDGISFEDEDEKEQWEEDQRVSARLGFRQPSKCRLSSVACT